ncbi:MAG: hypothetical protein EPO11_06470, partial [Gammaproteobacteria bacterium]
MKKWYALMLASLSLLSLTVPSVTYAFHRAGAATFSLGGGYYYFASKRHIEDTSVPFAAVGYDLTDHWGAEALLSVFTTDS